MNLNQLRFTKAVAENGSFSRAAEICFVTQPTLSNAISQLEEELGDRIFRRTTRNVSITPFGRHVLPLIEAVLTAQSELLSGAKAFYEPTHRLIRIGLSPLVDVRLLDQLLAPFAAKHPEVEIFFKQCFLDDMDERIESGTVEIAIVPRTLPRVGRERCVLYSEPLFFLPRQDDAIVPPPAASCRLQQYAEERMILTRGCGLSDVITELYKQEGIRLPIYPGQALSYQVVEDWAGLGIGSGILPRSKLSPANSSAYPITLTDGKQAQVSFEAHWLPESIRATHVAALVAHLREVVPDLAKGLAA